VACWLFLFFAAFSAFAQINSDDSEAPAKLLPPYGEMPSSFWQQHDVLIGWLTAAFVVAAAVIVAILLRRKPVIVLPPETQARRALNALVARPEDGVALSEVSQTLRQYFVAAFQLPAEESTTAEFCRILAADQRIGAELSGAVGDFLGQCDVRKFSPSPEAQSMGAVSQALTLIGKAEDRRMAATQTSSEIRA
jgi:hypothetical protein